MKKRNMSKFTAIVLLITILTLIALAGTYAKYTSSFNGTGTATTADWNIDISSGETTFSDTFTITSDYRNVYPGGEFERLGTLTVNNKSTLVKAKIIEVAITDVKIDGQVNPITNLNIMEAVYGNIIEPGESADFDIFYDWEYTDEDETQYAGKPISFTVTVTVDQVVE